LPSSRHPANDGAFTAGPSWQAEKRRLCSVEPLPKLLKHLGDTEQQRQKDQRTLNQFDDTKNEYLLYICVEDYVRLRRSMPIPMQIFQAWFCACHVHLLAFQAAQKFLDRFPGIQEMSRAQQKRGVAARIERFSNDAKLLAYPGTEPLVIDH
jgi:hypothetical protein